METSQTPPQDPRLDRGMPDLGALSAVTALDEITTRVLAPNPSPMTLDGTNTYVVASAGVAVVIDPGPDIDTHAHRVDEILASQDAACRMVLVTHHHVDHAAAAAAWAERFGAVVAAPTREVAGDEGQVVVDGDVIEAGALRIEAIATPGHTADHTAYRLPTGALCTGDHVLGRGTSVVAHPDGDLRAYLASLRRVLEMGPDVMLPGHGPELTQDPTAVVRYYLEHRAFRERQILAGLASGDRTPRQLVERIYADVDRRLWDAAEASTRAALDKLEAEGRVACSDGVVSRVEVAS